MFRHLLAIIKQSVVFCLQIFKKNIGMEESKKTMHATLTVMIPRVQQKAGNWLSEQLSATEVLCS